MTTARSEKPTGNARGGQQNDKRSGPMTCAGRRQRTKDNGPRTTTSGHFRDNENSMSFRRLGPIITFAFWLAAANVAQAAAPGPLSPGRQIILDRGLQIQSLGFVDSTPTAPSSYSVWADAGFTTFCSWYDTNSEKKLAWTMPWKIGRASC